MPKVTEADFRKRFQEVFPDGTSIMPTRRLYDKYLAEKDELEEKWENDEMTVDEAITFSLLKYGYALYQEKIDAAKKDNPDMSDEEALDYVTENTPPSPFEEQESIDVPVTYDPEEDGQLQFDGDGWREAMWRRASEGIERTDRAMRSKAARERGDKVDENEK